MGFRGGKGEVASLLCFVAVVVLRGVGAPVVGDEEQERASPEAGKVSSSPLAPRTERADPLDGLEKYTGGFNITNKHYLSSTIFTGKYGYFIAILWLLCGLFYASRLIISSCFYNVGEREKQIVIFMTYLSSLLLFLVIIASAVALQGSSKFKSRAMMIRNIVVETTNNASGTIYTVTEAIESLQNDAQIRQDVEGFSLLKMTSKKLNDKASNIKGKVESTMNWVSKGLNLVNAVTVITVTLNLVSTISLLVLGIIRFHQTSQILIIICWLLTFSLWVLFGLYYFFGIFAGDICMALDEFSQNPEQSTLNTVFACSDRNSSQAILHDVGERIYDLIQQVNSNITLLRSSFSELEYICNPFSSPPEFDYQPESCSSDSIRIGDLPKIIEKFTCSGASTGVCRPGQFIPARIYNEVELYTNSIQDILDCYPVMKSLVDCQLLKDSLSQVLLHHCSPLKRYASTSWASMAALSTIMAVLVLTWASGFHQKPIED
ncbi:hypothetical protein AXF42_Ash003369 [Apostasia shenzhenica]|uniref:Uncharacterized protein n=1 Tax=Apostasia shenzhenica TaxID=1088818 RepID=A0A2I0BG15_9ASPA|nr:hypothetical protein AXF42_Ash003369 [Apostasia shenzhenica]